VRIRNNNIKYNKENDNNNYNNNNIFKVNLSSAWAGKRVALTDSNSPVSLDAQLNDSMSSTSSASSTGSEESTSPGAFEKNTRSPRLNFPKFPSTIEH
jgi:hypothetical protein